MTTPGSSRPEQALRDSLAAALRIDADSCVWQEIHGGVSSEVWRIETGTELGTACLKRPLGKLRVSGDWRAPLDRAAWEARWLDESSRALPGRVPELWGYDPNTRAIIMPWLQPADHPVWKTELLGGRPDAAFAAAVGSTLAQLHALHAGKADDWVAAKELFRQLRLDPYFAATAQRHPRLASALDSIVAELAASTTTVIHGDFSPKNILHGPDGPVILDAECASAGDSVFDAAFCLNHLALKATHLPQHRDQLMECARRFVQAYESGVTWEPLAELNARIGRYLPALALARIDGLSPVEYLTDAERELTTAVAYDLLTRPPADAREALDRWTTFLKEKQ